MQKDHDGVFLVFVSSTFSDMVEDRLEVVNTINEMANFKSINMESFGSRPGAPLTESVRAVPSADIFVCIVGGRYGTGITEQEYDKARDEGLDCLIFFKALPKLESSDKDQDSTEVSRLDIFKEKLTDPVRGHLITKYTSRAELVHRVLLSLHNWWRETVINANANKSAGLAAERKEIQQLIIDGDIARAVKRLLDFAHQYANTRGIDLAIERSFAVNYIKRQQDDHAIGLEEATRLLAQEARKILSVIEAIIPQLSDRHA
ncbi:MULTISPECIES: DUF4062 domain-containing protein [unclassified Bradyrhizobium]|uniref:DUF4062 domain-containing protein n=1 Tax=unclassified Bradyrhizobium TaxID=2631580 RepID=UPI002916AF02|nr:MULTISPECIES: DUF4062 domain-containing protein [unclassified Bradyrhizobium]